MKIADKDEFEKQNVFGTGTPNTAYAKYFIGESYLNPLTKPEDGLHLLNVTFEPGCRNNWHIHHAKSGGGQLLIQLVKHLEETRVLRNVVDLVLDHLALLGTTSLAPDVECQFHL